MDVIVETGIPLFKRRGILNEENRSFLEREMIEDKPYRNKNATSFKR